VTRSATTAIFFVIVLTSRVAAQHYQTDFPPEEFAARWQVLFDRIGNAVAVVQGMPLTDGYTVPRQYNTFYYLSGIETPGAYLSFDGRTRRATLYLPRRNEALERAEGRVLSAA
jgi:Xaa-Pro aminopeptidase